MPAMGAVPALPRGDIMKYACWFPSPADYPPVESRPGYLSNSTVYTVVADSAQDAAKAFLSAHGKSAGDVEVCWSFTEGKSRTKISISEKATPCLNKGV